MISNAALAISFNASPHQGRNTYTIMEVAKRGHRKERFPVDFAAAYALGLRLLEHAIKLPGQL